MQRRHNEPVEMVHQIVEDAAGQGLAVAAPGHDFSDCTGILDAFP